MRQGWWIAVAGVAVLAACTGGASTDQQAEEVASISRPDLEVFMTLDATPDHARGVRRVIRRSDQVRSFSHLSPQDALRVFRRLFADQPDLIADTTADDLPSSFVIRLVDAKEFKELERRVQHLPGVDEVKRQSTANEQSKVIERLCEWRLEHAGPGDIEVFLRIGATTAETEAVRAALEQAPEVRSFRFLNHDDALREFRKIFADKPKLLRDTTADQLPASFRVDVAPGERATELMGRLSATPGVDEVVERMTRNQCRALIGEAL